ncbi:MAG: UDP-N-acetylmuramoyl-L-alanyl-D-glutamate--2,6-diaminopimelate ligase [Treponema sp.]|jgi:UDP-N-acetylmuramoyl-L-alanyl-D-glutamate--2,6-diaminopimelate ligase|nr:UDP-N-acetylmuramoyl-L-alanyl-D-glutamate--2,6-diaminopimelate ligase [Treponema sp.]
MKRALSSFFTPEIMEKAGFIERRGGGDPLITALEYDSRKIKEGNLYFALPGFHTDGRLFIPEAVEKGAGAVIYQGEPPAFAEGIVYIQVRDSRFALSPLADSYYDHPSGSLGIIGVTGTEGKSTTVYLIWQLLTLLGEKAGFVSTVQYSVGGEERWNPEHQTTPEATAIHRRLAEMRDYGASWAVLESSSHGLSPRTNRLGDVAFDAGVMTNVAHEHLEFHGSWEQYRHDKANLFRSLGLFSHTKEIGGKKRDIPAFAVANGDDRSCSYFAAAAFGKTGAAEKAPPGFRTYTYSTRGAAADLRVKAVRSGAGGNRYRVLIREDDNSETEAEIEDRLPGAFNPGNVLAALLVTAKLTGKRIAELIPLVLRLKPVRGRMTRVDRGQNFEVLVDYAHTPSSFSAVFPPLRERMDRDGGRIISLFGSAGERDTAKRPEQGRIAAECSDLMILTDEDPRGEEPIFILEEIAAGIRDNEKKQWVRGDNLFLIPDRRQAIRKAFSLARAGDLVLLLGKGHENSIIYAKGALAFDEITEAEKALEEQRQDPGSLPD